MDDVQELIAIQQEVERISDRLRKIFPSTHPQFDSVFEDVGAKTPIIHPPNRKASRFKSENPLLAPGSPVIQNSF